MSLQFVYPSVMYFMRQNIWLKRQVARVSLRVQVLSLYMGTNLTGVQALTCEGSILLLWTSLHALKRNHFTPRNQVTLLVIRERVYMHCNNLVTVHMQQASNQISFLSVCFIWKPLVHGPELFNWWPVGQLRPLDHFLSRLTVMVWVLCCSLFLLCFVVSLLSCVMLYCPPPVIVFFPIHFLRTPVRHHSISPCVPRPCLSLISCWFVCVSCVCCSLCLLCVATFIPPWLSPAVHWNNRPLLLYPGLLSARCHIVIACSSWYMVYTVFSS